MTIPDYVHEYFSRVDGPIREPLQCNNGLYLSVQASHFHASVPRNDDGPYTHVEVCVVPFDDGSDAADVATIIPEGFVPVDQVNEAIHAAGGLVEPWPSMYVD